jgi:hypothetical protein
VVRPRDQSGIHRSNGGRARAVRASL